MKRHFFDNLESKTVIVAGGNGLIGSAIVKQLEFYGANVVCADIVGKGEYLDIGDPETLRFLFGKYYQYYSQIDAFVDCAYPQKVLEPMKWCQTYEDIAGYLSICGGSIILFSSIYGQVGPRMDIYKDNEIEPPTAQYAFNKAGIIGITKYIAAKYGKYGLRCNVVCPGGVLDKQSASFINNYIKRVPLGRMALPSDIVGVVLFLISDWSKYITGQIIAIDGGLTSI